MYIPIKSYYKLKGVIKMQQSYLNYPPQLSSFVPSQIYLANNYQPMLQKNGTIPYYPPMPNGSMMSFRFENPEHIQRVGRPQSLQYSRNAYNSPKYYNTLQNSELVVNSDKWNLSQSNVIANPSNFPFGRDRIKLSNYVTEKLQWQNDQENKRVLQKFRIDAIKNRNQRVMKHLGKMPYITQSMLPGSNIDASKYMETPEKAPIYPKKVDPAPLMPVTYFADPRFAYIQTKRVQTVGVQANIPQKGQQMIKIPRKVGQTTSVGISVNFQQQFPLKPYKTPKKNKKKRGYTIQQQQQVKSMNKISSMIHEINKKLKKNGEMLQESLLQNVSLAQSRAISQKQSPIKKFSYSRRNFFPQSSKIKKDVQPSVVYHNKNKRSKTEASEYNQQKQPKREINQHLQLLKLNKKRIEDLDEYVYKL